MNNPNPWCKECADMHDGFWGSYMTCTKHNYDGSDKVCELVEPCEEGAEMNCANFLNQKVIIVAHNQEQGRTWAKLKLLNSQRIPAIISTPAGVAGIRGHLVIDLCGIADCPHWRADLLNNLVIQDV